MQARRVDRFGGQMKRELVCVCVCVQLHASGSFNVKHGLPIARPKKLFILSDRPPQFLGVKFVLCGLHNLGCWLFSNRDSTKPWLPPQDNINNIPKYCSLAIRACHLHSKFSCATPQWYYSTRVIFTKDGYAKFLHSAEA